MDTPIQSPSLANLKPAWKKGDPSPNPKGKPKGQRSYATIYREALIKIGKAKNMTPEEVEEEMHRSGLDSALKGNFAFYKDTLDRLHGKPKEAVDITSGGEKITGVVVSFSGEASDTDTSGFETSL